MIYCIICTKTKECSFCGFIEVYVQTVLFTRWLSGLSMPRQNQASFVALFPVCYAKLTVCWLLIIDMASISSCNHGKKAIKHICQTIPLKGLSWLPLGVCGGVCPGCRSLSGGWRPAAVGCCSLCCRWLSVLKVLMNVSSPLPAGACWRNIARSH